MSAPRPDPDQARSFGRVADAYDRARPSYPPKAAQWLAGPTPARVLELGAGTGKLTELLVSLGHTVTATDPSEQMLRLLTARVPRAHVAIGAAERVPVASRSVDLVVAAQAFHWFDLDLALPEIARVLRPAGRIGLIWHLRDERIPWVRRLGALLGEAQHGRLEDVVPALDACELFEEVETATFRFWQPLTRRSLRDLVTSRSNIAVLSDLERERVLVSVDALYDEYGRGPDGMLLPYVTHTFRATARPRRGPLPGPAPDGPDTDALLIDFR